MTPVVCLSQSLTTPQDEERPAWADDIAIDDIIPETAQARSSKSDDKKRKRLNEEGFELEGDDRDGIEDPRKRKYDEYMDEVYELDFNDMVRPFLPQMVFYSPTSQVGGMPTRFKWTTVAPDSSGLTAAEILLATDRELNEFMSIKKLAPFKNKTAWDRERITKLKELKDKIAHRSWGGVPVAELANEQGDGQDGAQGGKTKKRKGKKERQKQKNLASANGDQQAEVAMEEETTGINDVADTTTEADVVERPVKKRRRKNKAAQE